MTSMQIPAANSIPDPGEGSGVIPARAGPAAALAGLLAPLACHSAGNGGTRATAHLGHCL